MNWLGFLFLVAEIFVYASQIDNKYTMNKITCPLCNSINTRLVETIKTSEIAEQYVRQLGATASFQSNSIRYAVCANCGLGFFDPMAAGDEKLYEQLQKFEWYYMSDKPEYAMAKKYLPSTGDVIEVGSGKAAFADIVGKNRYVGLEFNDEAIVRAKVEGVTLLKESIEDHAANNKEKYKAVVSFQVLEHVSNPSSFIQGCVDSLQAGGHLILAVPNHDGICGLSQNNILDIPPHHVSHWAEKTMRHIAIQYDLEIVAIDFERVASFHKTWAAKSIYEQKLRRIFGVQPKLLDVSFFSRLLGKIASVSSRIIPPDLGAIKGHTVLACYRKK